MPYPDTFTGYQVASASTWTTFHRATITPKPFGPYDVDIKIHACGICGSDVHTISGGWGEQKFPLCVGHEIVGEALKIGEKVTLVKVGQRVGVGAQCYSCLNCRQCASDNETYCRHQLDTYGSVWPDTGIVSQGGYASHIRAHEHWVFPIPAALPTTSAAPMLCAGITAYSPLVRNGCGPGKKVGIVGMGGIGHYGLLFAKAYIRMANNADFDVEVGAEVWAISRSHAKEADAKEMGADGFIATADSEWEKEHVMTFDLIVNTANSNEGFELGRYLSLLDVHGRWISVGLPEGAGSLIKTQDFMENGCLIGASHLGSRKETIAMLDLAADKGIKSWVEEVQIGEKELSEAVQRLHKNDVRYRFTLTGYDKVFGDA